MKKELKKANTNLSLGKMTVAKLRLNHQQMQLMYGGNGTTNNDLTTNTQTSLYDECTSHSCWCTGLKTN
jgi:hypothetical protein